MSSTQDPNPPETDPRGGDGPNQVDRAGDDSTAGSGAERRQDEGRGEQGGGGGQGGDAPKTASKGINPVQHSE